jgi:alpha-galactosidase
VGNQGHTYGIASWIPYYGTGTGATDSYLLRSVMCPHFTACLDMRRKDLDYGLVRRILGQWRQFAPYYLGDYYPLTPYSLDGAVWIAWQFDCPEKGEGMVQAFRRGESIYDSARFRLHGLEPDAVYTLSNFDVAGTTEMMGRELQAHGLPIAIKDHPGSAIIVYKKKL